MGEFARKPSWLKEVWGKWPGDEPIEESLAMLEGDSEKTRSTAEKTTRQGAAQEKDEQLGYN